MPPCLDLRFSCTRRQRDQLVRYLDLLANNPFQRGDYEEKGATDRTYQIRLMRPFMITFWVDHAVKEVRVVAIRKI